MRLGVGNFSLRGFLLGEAQRQADGTFPPPLLAGTKPLLRYAWVASATLLAALLHVAVFFWYVTRPAQLPLRAAAPLPMVALVLSAPPSATPADAPPVAPPQPVQPKAAQRPAPKPAPKPQPKPAQKPKPKPKPVHRDTAVKQRVKPAQKVQAAPESAPQPAPAHAAPAAPVPAPAAAPRNERYTPASSNANYLHNPAPDYPLAARQNHWQGRVLLRVLISANGQCEKLFVQRSSGHAALDGSALAAVRHWRFVPAKRGDTPEASWATVPIDFELD